MRAVQASGGAGAAPFLVIATSYHTLAELAGISTDLWFDVIEEIAANRERPLAEKAVHAAVAAVASHQYDEALFFTRIVVKDPAKVKPLGQKLEALGPDLLESFVNSIKTSDYAGKKELILQVFGRWDETHRHEPTELCKKVLGQLDNWIDRGITAKRNDGQGRNQCTLADMRTRA